jgi:phage repressor protein C with HTH and peptisase S24 domain
VVKRVERVPASDPPEIVLISDNKNHNQYRVPAEMVRVIGRVVWFARRI